MSAEEHLLSAILGDEETERQAAAALREKRARLALEQAPDLAETIRGKVQHTDGRTERGEAFTVERTPLLTTEADDADAMYVRLIEWVRFWGETLGDAVPSTVRVAWQRIDEDSRASAPENQHMGFKARTTPAGARFLTSMLTTWLLIRHERMTGDSLEAYLDDVTTIVWGLRARYGLTPVRERLVSLSPCPECGEAAVGAVWSSAIITDVVISCEHCGYTEPTPSTSKIEKWLSLSDPGLALSAVCGEWRHEDCEECECPCHPMAKAAMSAYEIAQLNKRGKADGS